MAIGSRISERLEELKWKPKDLVNAVEDLTAQSLSNIIKRDSIRSEWDEKIASALGVSVLWLVYGDSSQQKAHSLTEQESDLVSAFRSLPLVDQQHAVLDMQYKSAKIALGRSPPKDKRTA